MKNYTITVNGNVYDVTVEESGAAPVAAPKALYPALQQPRQHQQLRLHQPRPPQQLLLLQQLRQVQQAASA